MKETNNRRYMCLFEIEHVPRFGTFQTFSFLKPLLKMNLKNTNIDCF